MKSGWLKRELDSAALKVSQWPQWMKDAAGVKMFYVFDDEIKDKFLDNLINWAKELKKDNTVRIVDIDYDLYMDVAKGTNNIKLTVEVGSTNPIPTLAPHWK